MSYPSLEKYNEAFQHHQRFLFDPLLKNGVLKKTGLGTPLVIGGGFALTYTIESNNKKYAVRCFHKESKGLERRYDEIAKKIKLLSSSFFLDFEFQQKGVLVNGSTYPIVKMAWANGITLGEFIEDHYDNASYLKNLSNALVKLAQYLEQQKIAHGDIQTGNVMVASAGNSIQLIDYDGMYVDALANLGSAELGHINFQHPERAKQNPFNYRIDRFSLASIWLALKALELDSSIWHKTKSDMDVIVFRSTDFINPNASTTLSLLKNYPALTKYVNNFAALCNSTDLYNLPSLEDFISGKNIPASGNINITARNVSRAVAINTYISPYPIVSASNYNQCLQNVGSQVEVIGKITEVKEGTARNGMPYIFINFGNWQGNIFKITIWSEGIDALSNVPDSSWKGRWISVKGLMDAPFVSKKLNYSHLSITITKKSQLALIDEVEAQFRLSGKTQLPTSNSSTQNSDIITKINRGASAPRSSQVPNKPSVNQASSNQALLNKIHATTGKPSAVSPQNTHHGRTGQNPASNKPSVPLYSPKPFGYSSPPAFPPPKPSNPSVQKPTGSTDWIWSTVIWIFLIFIVLKACS